MTNIVPSDPRVLRFPYDAWRDNQAEVIEHIIKSPAKVTFLSAPTGTGKALSLDTKIPTPEGWTTMGEISIDDEVFDENGNICKVLAVSPVMENRNVFEVFFKDGTSLKADEDHLWSVQTADDRASRNESWREYHRHSNSLHRIITTHQLRSNLKRKDGRSNYSIQVTRPLVLPSRKDLPISPYLLGIWLGDGKSNGSSIYTSDQEVIDRISDEGNKVEKRKGKYEYQVFDLYRKLRLNNLLGNKHIPSEYLRSSVDQRLDLLQGLMDSDGYCSTKSSCEFTNKNEKLASGFLDLIRTLGIKGRIRKERAKLYGKDCGEKYRILFSTNMPVFSLTRKKSRLREKTRSTQTSHYIDKITKVDTIPVRCIRVSSDSGLYLAGESLIPTHNSGIALGIAKLGGVKSAIVTHTKQLQNQYVSEFRALDLTRLIGRDNYKCLIDRRFTVSEAPCNTGWKCGKMYHCPYFVTKAKAAEWATPVVTNYPYFLGEVQNGGLLRDLDILILDEGHLAENALMSHVNVSLDEADLRKVGIVLPRLGTIDQYKDWAFKAAMPLTQEMNKIAKYLTESSTDPFQDEILVRRYKSIKTQLTVLRGLNTLVGDDWILEIQRKRVLFRPLWVKSYGNLYTHTATKIVIQSATIASPKKMADLLGITDWEYIEIPSGFDKNRRPLFYWPIAKVGMALPEDDAKALVDAADQIIDKHPGERGIIHTANYMLRDMIMLRSKNKGIMMTHTGNDREQVIEKFLEDGGGARILVSPSVISGVNASYHRCGYQIILKVPFADKGDEQTRRRMEEDPEWYNFNAVSSLVQAYGRAMRYEDDYGETYVLDEHFGWFFSRNFDMYPKWFREAVIKINNV